MKPQELVLALRAMGLTQQQIQERTGIPQPTISKIGQNGERDVMLRTYLALRTAYEQLLLAGPMPARRGKPAPTAGGDGQSPAQSTSPGAPAEPAPRRRPVRRTANKPPSVRDFPHGPLPWPSPLRD